MKHALDLDWPTEEQPAELIHFLYRIKRYEQGIYVREQVDGQWENPSLAELSPERWAHHVNRMLGQQIWPVRLKEEGEE